MCGHHEHIPVIAGFRDWDLDYKSVVIQFGYDAGWTEVPRVITKFTPLCDRTGFLCCRKCLEYHNPKSSSPQ